MGIIPYLSEFFRLETSAVLAKHGAKTLSNATRDSNVPFNVGPERKGEGGWGGGEVGAALHEWFLERLWYKFSLRRLDSMIEDRSDNRA